MKTNMILQGDALKILQKLPRGSINMVITSPPYWALRDYGISTESIWDGKKDCRHDWISNEFRLHSGRGDCQKTAKYSEQENIPDKRLIHNICQKCGAWKGQLGLEPDFNLYINHLCDVFEEVKRVLRKDGTCWVNLGDTYYTKSGGKFENDTIAKKSANEVSNTTGINLANELRGRGLLQDKNLTLIPFRFALEMQNRGWILRNVIIWHKPNCMPTSVKDRFTVDFEYLFFFVKNKKYFFEQQREPHKLESLKRIKYKWNGHREPGSSYVGMNIKKMCHPNGRNKRCVWTISTGSFRGAHFAVYPPELIEIPINAGCPKFVCRKCGNPKIMRTEKGKILEKRKPEKGLRAKFDKQGGLRNGYEKRETLNKGYKATCNCNGGFSPGIVLDPFFGAGTTGLVALRQNKKFMGIELNPKYVKIAKKRLRRIL